MVKISYFGNAVIGADIGWILFDIVIPVFGWDSSSFAISNGSWFFDGLFIDVLNLIFNNFFV